MGGHDVGDKRLDLIGVGDIGVDELRIAPGLPNQGDGRFAALLIDIGTGNDCAGGGESQRRRATNTAAASGDQS